MEAFLQCLLPRLVEDWREQEHFLCIPHQGVSDLKKSLRRKLPGWQKPGDHFVILLDSDNADCKQRKQEIVAQCQGATSKGVIVRLVCQELESWYLGDLPALVQAFDNPGLNAARLCKPSSNPDEIPKPSQRLQQGVPRFQKVRDAKRIAPHLALDDSNRSHSFRLFIHTVRQLSRDLHQ